VTEVQRARILSAAARVVEELGYDGMSVARITARAGVSRRTFYDQFDGREDCFLALFDQAVARAGGIAQEAMIAAGRKGWREHVRSGLGALLLLFDDEPAVGSLLIVETLGAGPRVLERRASVLDSLKRIVDEGRNEAKWGEGSSPLTAEGVVGAVFSVIHARLLEQRERAVTRSANASSRGNGRQGSLTGLLNPLMGMIVLPYLGRTAAVKELARPMPRRPRTVRAPLARSQPSVDPLDGLEMRLTYRTLQVLSAIATNPGTSNRQIADTAGVHDQGQISRLLARLERLGLIHNTGHGQPRGEPNAWTLTTKGTQVAQATQAHPQTL
jgi:AcrR family transcriptional regulator/DNA-binding MarR family transcriptional regulator